LRGVVDQFDLVLAYPQWQGSGRSENLKRGAQAAAHVCERYGPLAHVPEAGTGEARGGVNRWTAIIEQFRSAQHILSEKQPRSVLTAGGDCACDIAIIDYLHRKYPDLTVIWVDAHLDANTVMTSPSGDFHGMPVASLMGQAPAELAVLLGTPLPPSNFRYVSAHVGDEGDWTFQRDNGLAWLDPGEPISGPVHIHFDLDALNPLAFPHLAYPDGNLSMKAGLSLVRKVADSGLLVGLTITEFAPVDQTAADGGSDYLDQLCRAAARV
jgi:arginase